MDINKLEEYFGNVCGLAIKPENFLGHEKIHEVLRSQDISDSPYAGAFAVNIIISGIILSSSEKTSDKEKAFSLIQYGLGLSDHLNYDIEARIGQTLKNSLDGPLREFSV